LLAWLVLDAPLIMGAVKPKHIKLFSIHDFLLPPTMKMFAKDNLGLNEWTEEDCTELKESRDRLRTYVEDVNMLKQCTKKSEESWK